MPGFPNAGRTWFTSSKSSPAGHCVEVAIDPDAVLVRDSKNRAAGNLSFAGERWSEFVAAVRAGEFDRPTI